MNLGDIEFPTDVVSARMVEEAWKFLKGKVLLENDGTAMGGHINLKNHRIVNLDLPVHSNDAANKTYVDGLIPKPKPIISIVTQKVKNIIKWVMKKKKRKILAMSLSVIQRNGNSDEDVGVGATVSGPFQVDNDITKNPCYYTVERTFKGPLEVDKGDIINFQTRESTMTNASRVVAQRIELVM